MIARQMKFSVESSVKIGGRLGHLELPRPSSGENVVYPTPMFFIHTLSGSIPHITHEVFNLIFNKDDPPIQMSLDSMFTFNHVVGPSGMNISKFVGLTDSPSLLTFLNPAATFEPGFNSKLGVSLWGRCGRRAVSVQQFTQIISDFQPTIFQCMSDYDVNSMTTKDKRLKKSTERSVKYLEDVLVKLKGKSHDSHPTSSCPGVLATIEPAWFTINEMEGTNALVSILENRSQISGFFMKKNDDDEKSFSSMTKPLLEKLPVDKFRYASGTFDLDEIMELVLQGFDVFDSSICTKLTDEGKALILPSLFSTKTGGNLNEDLPVHDSSSDLGSGASPALSSSPVHHLEILDLSDKINFDDFRPLASDCNCYTCRKYTRSYIHHLRCTKELLGQVLLMTHNLITFDRFFKVLRLSLGSQESVDFNKLRQSVQMTDDNHDKVEKEGKESLEQLS